MNLKFNCCYRYKKIFTHDEAIKMILDGECGIFSPTLMRILKEIENEFKMVNNNTNNR